MRAMILGTNGNGGIVERLTRSTAEMSSHEKSAQADTMRQKLVELAAAHNRLVAVVDAQGVSLTALTQALAEMAPIMRQTVEQVGTLATSQAETLARIDVIEAGIGLHSATMRRFTFPVTFLARLRWIFRGV